MDQAVKQAGSTGVQNRVAWLDAAKCIGIFLVILGHINVKTYGFVSSWAFINTFHMPLFFFLAGLTQKRLSFKESVCDAARKLLVPYVIFYFLTWLWWFFVSCLRHPELYPINNIFENAIKKRFMGLLLANAYSTKFSIMQTGPLWFLVALFWCKMLYSLVQNKAKNPTTVNFILTIVLLFLGVVFRYFEIPKMITVVTEEYTVKYFERSIPFSLQTLTIRYVWFFTGTLFKTRLFTNEMQKHKAKSVVLMVLFIVFTFVVYFFYKYSEMRDIYLSLLLATCGITFVFELSLLISPLPSFFSFLGRNTITILAFHWIANELPAVFMKYVFHRKLVAPFSIWVALLIAVSSLLICAVPAFVFERWFPFVLGRRKKPCFASVENKD